MASYDWEIIAAQRNPEEAYYRLLGEMLHRRATSQDLQKIRTFLSQANLGDEVWLSLGEGLFQTTSGASIGYRMWCAWSRAVLPTEYDEVHQLEAWQRFQAGISDGLEVHSEPDRTFEVAEEELDDQGQRTDREPPSSVTRIVEPASVATERLAQDPMLAIALIPSGPHTIRIFDQVFERIDEFAILRLLQMGVFFELEVLFGVRWIHVGEHPGFVSIIHRLREEALGELATTEIARAEVTQPG